MQIIIDRFEGEYAVVELPNREIINVPKVLFGGAKQGDVVDIIVNKNETEQRRLGIQKRFDRLKK